MKKKILSFIVFLFIFVTLQAQQAAQYSLYMLNPYSYNVGYAGLDNSLSANAQYRKQWSGLEGAPISKVINAHLPLSYLHGGFGINIEQDQISALRNIAATVSYCHYVRLGVGTTLSLGIGGGVIQQVLDGSILRTPGGNYEPGAGFSHNDFILSENLGTTNAKIFQTGVYLRNKRLELGIAANNLTQEVLKYTIKDIKIRSKRNFFINFATNFDLGTKINVRPSFLVKSDLIETQIEMSSMFKYNDNFFVGASYRGYNAKTGDGLVYIVGIKLNDKISLAYSYDMTLSKLKTSNSGSHEILLNYNLHKTLGEGKLERIIYNPRYL